MIICCTCRLSARPYPTTARFTSAGVYSTHLAAGFDGGEHRDAARVTELERAAGVDGVKQVLDRDALRLALGEAC